MPHRPCEQEEGGSCPWQVERAARLLQPDSGWDQCFAYTLAQTEHFWWVCWLHWRAWVLLGHFFGHKLGCPITVAKLWASHGNTNISMVGELRGCWLTVHASGTALPSPAWRGREHSHCKDWWRDKVTYCLRSPQRRSWGFHDVVCPHREERNRILYVLATDRFPL